MTNASNILIGVVGSSRPTGDEWRVAFEVGREIALRKGIVVTGGLGGVMEAASKGAKESGGITVGILPGDSRLEANSSVDIPVVTGLAEARNLIIAKSSRALIAVGGGYGTLSEIALGLRAGVPVIGIRTWELSISGAGDESITKAGTAREAVDLAFKLCTR